MTIQQVLKKPSENLLITQFENVTEFATSLDDSVTVVHQGATIQNCSDCSDLLDKDVFCPSCSDSGIDVVNHISSDVQSTYVELSTAIYCYQCNKRVTYLFPDSRCKDCTRVTPDELVGNTLDESVVHQGTTFVFDLSDPTCHYCDNEVDYLFSDGRCKDCSTAMSDELDALIVSMRCPNCGLIPDALYEDTALGCSCSVVEA